MIENKVVPWRVRSNYNLPRRALAVLSSLKGLKYFFLIRNPALKRWAIFRRELLIGGCNGREKNEDSYSGIASAYLNGPHYNSSDARRPTGDGAGGTEPEPDSVAFAVLAPNLERA